MLWAGRKKWSFEILDNVSLCVLGIACCYNAPFVVRAGEWEGGKRGVGVLQARVGWALLAQRKVDSRAVTCVTMKERNRAYDVL